MNNMKDLIVTAMKELGFSEEEAEKQLLELDEAMLRSFGMTIKETYPEIDWDAERPFANVGQDTENIKKIFSDHVSVLLQQYFEAISANATEDQRERFFSRVKDIVDYSKTFEEVEK